VTVASEHTIRRRVQFSETDAAGIVHFSCFFRYMEDAEHAMWREAGLSIHPPDSPIGWPRVGTSFEFHRPLRFEQEFDVTIRVVELTNRTIGYACDITQNDRKVATGTMKIACVAKLPDGSMRSVDIPDDVATRFTPSVNRASPIAPRASDT
jgi:YbgC/YbaW family acyl-CoA thioester hydrolase